MPDDQNSPDVEILVSQLAEVEAGHLTEADSTLQELKAELDTLANELRETPPVNEFRDESDCQRAVEMAVLAGLESAGRKLVETHDRHLQQIGPYKVLEKLGEGGMGAVYKAQHTRLKRTVAIKVLRADRVQNLDAIARFEREMEAVGALQHPNIVTAHDAGEASDTHFLAMEFVDGLDLSTLVRRTGVLSVADACEIARQAAMGLQEAHEHGMVHRDIKPSNLMLARSSRSQRTPVVKILDLGLALLGERHTERHDLTSTGQMMGTLEYMAPEQGGDSHEVDIRADIFSLGATLFRLLTGSAPFAGDCYRTPIQLLTALANEAAPSIASRRDDLPTVLGDLIDRMVSRSPADRPTSPDEIVLALGPFCNGADLGGLLERAQQTTAIEESESVSMDTHSYARSLSHPTAEDGISMPAEALKRDEIDWQQDTIHENLSPLPSEDGSAAVDSVRANSAHESLKFQIKQDTKGPPAPELQPQPARNSGSFPPRSRTKLLFWGGSASLILLAGILFKIMTNDGAIVLTGDPSALEGARVLVDNQEVQIIQGMDNENRINISVDEDRGELRVEKDGFVAFVEKFDLTLPGNDEPITVTLERTELPAKDRPSSGDSVRSPSAMMPNLPGPGGVLGRLTADPGERAKLPGYATMPASLPFTNMLWQPIPRFPHFTNTTTYISPKGTFVACAHDWTYAPYLRILNRETGRLESIIRVGGERRITWSPDESQYAVLERLSNKSWITVRSHDGLVSARWELPRIATAIAWSPEGDRILVSSSDYIAQWFPSGQVVSDFEEPETGGPAFWSPDGSRFACNGNNSVLVFNSVGGMPTAELREDELTIQRWLWHPSNQMLLMTGKRQENGLREDVKYLWNLDGTYRRIGHSPNEPTIAISPEGDYLLNSLGEIRDESNTVAARIDLAALNIKQITKAVWLERDRLILFSYERGPGFSAEWNGIGKPLTIIDHPVPVPQLSVSWSDSQARLRSIAGYRGSRGWNITWGVDHAEDQAAELGFGGGGYAAFTSDGKKLAVTARSTGLTSVIQGDRKLYELEGTAGALKSWSHDGELLAYALGSRVFVYRGTEKIGEFNDHRENVEGIIWQPGQHTFVSWANNDPVIVRDMTDVSNSARTLSTDGLTDWSQATCPRWSPDGAHLAIPQRTGVEISSGNDNQVLQIPWQHPGLIWWVNDAEILVENQVYNLDGVVISQAPTGLALTPFVDIWTEDQIVTAGHSYVEGPLVLLTTGRKEKTIPLPGFTCAGIPRISLQSRGMGSRRISKGGHFLIHHSTVTSQVSFASHTLGDIHLVDLDQQKHVWSGIAFSDGHRARIEPSGRTTCSAVDSDLYINYVIQYPNGRILPLTGTELETRLGYSPGQQFVQRMLDIGGRIETSDGMLTDVNQRLDPAVIRSLDLTDNYYLTDADLAGIGELKGLRQLNLRNTQVTNQGLAELKLCSDLQNLDLSSLEISDTVIGDLPDGLVELNVSNTTIGDLALGGLSNFTELKSVAALNTKVTEGGIARLNQEIPECKVESNTGEH